MTLVEVMGRFESATQRGEKWSLRCPVHDDRVASVSAEERDGRVLMHCHAGCATSDVLGAVGLEIADLFVDPPAPAVSPAPTPVLRSSSNTVCYDYCSADGKVVHQVVRGPGKTFRQRTPKPGGGWAWKASGQRLPYRLPDLCGEGEVWVVEGEKDVDACWSRGMAATCNLGGAGKWREGETTALLGCAPKHVYIVPDGDDPGRKHAQDVWSQLNSAGLCATVVTLPNGSDHSDISDWFAAGHSADEAIKLSHQAVSDLAGPATHPPVDEFQKTGEGRYVLTLSAVGVTLEASELHRDRSRELHGELTVSTTNTQQKTVDGVMLWSSLNYSSARTRASTASSLGARSTLGGVDWAGALETLALRVARSESIGSEIGPLADHPVPEKTEGDWDVSGLPILRRHPMILFGDGGAAKSYLALHVAATLASRGIRVLYADWEFSGEDHRERLERLTGTAMPREALHYVRCSSPLISEVGRLQRHIASHGIQYVICDSIAFAVPGRPEDAENASAYFRAVRQLGIGSLHLAHTTKSSEHGEDKPFGSVFWSNGARSVWFIKRGSDHGESGRVDVALSHRKSNTGRRLPTFGLRLVFGDDRTDVERFEVAESDDLGSSLPIWQRVKALVAVRPMSIDALALALGEKPESVSRTVRRMDAFVRGQDGQIHLASRLNAGNTGRF